MYPQDFEQYVKKTIEKYPDLKKDIQEISLKTTNQYTNAQTAIWANDGGLSDIKILIEDHIQSNKIVVEGYSQAMDGNKLIVNLGEEGLMEITIKDKKKRWDFYCKMLKITIEK